MKSLITIIMVVCVMLCGCSKSSEYTVDGSCDICHKTKKLKEYRFEQKTYAVCKECYEEKILGYEADSEVYNNLIESINVVVQDDKNVSFITGKRITFNFDGSGIYCDNDEFAKYLQETTEIDFDVKARTGTYTILVSILAFPQNKPKHPLAE